MGRKAEPNWHRTRKAYCVMYNKIRHVLAYSDTDDRPDGPNWEKAQQAWIEIQKTGGRTLDANPTVKELIDEYSKWLTATYPRSVKGCMPFLRSFDKRAGKLRCDQITSPLVLDWIEGNKQWGTCSRWHALTRIRAMMTWAKKRCKIASNPISDLRTPSNYHSTARGDEYALPKELVDLSSTRPTGS